MFWLSLTLVVFWCHSTKGKPFLASGVIVSLRPAVILIADLTFLKPRFKLCSLNVYFKSQTTDVEIKGWLLVYMQFRQLLVCGKNDDHSVSFMFHRKFVRSLKCTTIRFFILLRLSICMELTTVRQSMSDRSSFTSDRIGSDRLLVTLVTCSVGKLLSFVESYKVIRVRKIIFL